MSSINITCGCKLSYLAFAKGEDFKGEIVPGTPIRISLVCPKCHKEYVLQATLTEVVKGDYRRARGCAPRPEGALSAEDAIRKGRGG